MYMNHHIIDQNNNYWFLDKPFCRHSNCPSTSTHVVMDIATVQLYRIACVVDLAGSTQWDETGGRQYECPQGHACCLPAGSSSCTLLERSTTKALLYLSDDNISTRISVRKWKQPTQTCESMRGFPRWGSDDIIGNSAFWQAVNQSACIILVTRSSCSPSITLVQYWWQYLPLPCEQLSLLVLIWLHTYHMINGSDKWNCTWVTLGDSMDNEVYLGLI